uniref:Uncharacterized protein n=1 Tax=Moniliophthora roreri TaxID=221103 RepID=A0A0W0F8C5_MONRR
MVRPVNPQHAAPTGASTASTSANTPSRAPARQHSGTPSKISRWELHDAPAIAKPESLDEHRQLAFRHLELSRFLFSTMLEEYPEQIPSPLKTFIQIVLETMPLDMQSIQPYMAELLRSIMLNARKNPIEVVECVNPAGPSSQPAVAYDGIAEQQIEQLHIPGSNQPSADEPFTLKQEKAPSGKTLVNLPFTVNAWGPKPKGNSTPASQIESRGGGSGSGGPPVQFENEKEAVLDRAAGKKRAREDVLGDGEVDTKAESTDRAPKIAKSRCEETVSSIRTVASEYISSRNSRTPSPGASAAASTSNQSSVRETLKRSLKWANLSLRTQNRL